MPDLHRTVIIHAVETGTSASIDMLPLRAGNEPEVFQTEGKDLAALLWAFLPEETIEALRVQLNYFEDERKVGQALKRIAARS